jgi:hypothetical protein
MGENIEICFGFNSDFRIVMRVIIYLHLSMEVELQSFISPSQDIRVSLLSSWAALIMGL